MASFHDAIQAMVRDAAKLAEGASVVGLGSGSTAAFIVKELTGLKDERMAFVPTSLQIKIEAEKNGLPIADESRIPEIDIVFDGADQIDKDFYMIKGGGGALLREKILISSAKKVVILADEAKFVSQFSRSVPIEVHPIARSSALKRLSELGGKPTLRVLEKGYPFITESGNIVLDTTFSSIDQPPVKELELKAIPGVMEVGIFTRKADVYYRAKHDGAFEQIKP